MLNILRVLLVGGNKTTTNLIGNGMLALPGYGRRLVASCSQHHVTERQQRSLGGIQRPERMRVRRGARFRIRIALWMLTGLESIQRGTKRNVYIMAS